MAESLAKNLSTNSYDDWIDNAYKDNPFSYSNVLNLMNKPEYYNNLELPNEKDYLGELANFVDDTRKMQGLGTLLSGVGTLGSFYTGYQQNKLAEKAHNARMAEFNRQRQRDIDFAKNINASGLGTYSSGVN